MKEEEPCPDCGKYPCRCMDYLFEDEEEYEESE